MLLNVLGASLFFFQKMHIKITISFLLFSHYIYLYYLFNLTLTRSMWERRRNDSSHTLVSETVGLGVIDLSDFPDTQPASKFASKPSPKRAPKSGLSFTSTPDSSKKGKGRERDGKEVKSDRPLKASRIPSIVHERLTFDSLATNTNYTATFLKDADTSKPVRYPQTYLLIFLLLYSITLKSLVFVCDILDISQFHRCRKRKSFLLILSLVL